MKYMLLVYLDEKAISEKEREQWRQASAQLADQLRKSGKSLAAAPLHSVETATSVQVREGKRLVIDAPFAETSEQLGGCFMVDVQDLDEAIDIAVRIPGAAVGTVEIRPMLEPNDRS